MTKDNTAFIKVPASLTPSLSRRFDDLEMSDSITAGFILAFYERNGSSPCLTLLARMMRRTTETTQYSINRLVAKGWITAKQFPRVYGTDLNGQPLKAMAWWYTIPTESPLREMVHSDKKSRPWVALPVAVAQCRSILAVGAYLICYAQRLADDAIVTTPSDLAGLLGCNVRTAHRLLGYIGAERVVTARQGRVLYDLAIRHCKPHTSTITMHGFEVAVYGNSERQYDRLAELRKALTRAGLDVEAIERDALASIARTRKPRLQLLVRLIEERQRVHLADDWGGYGAKLAARVGSRLRGMRYLRVRTVAQLHERQQVRAAIEFALSVASDCTDCANTGHAPTGRQTEYGEPLYGLCTTCCGVA